MWDERLQKKHYKILQGKIVEKALRNSIPHKSKRSTRICIETSLIRDAILCIFVVESYMIDILESFISRYRVTI